MGKIKNKSKSMSYRAYARHRGVSTEAVSKAVKTGRITADANGKIDPESADREWEANTDPVKARNRLGPGELPPLASVRTMGMLIDNKTKQTKLHLLEKKIYPLDKLRVDVFNITRIARDTVMNLPDRVSADLVGMDDFHEIHEYLREEVKTICYDLAESLKNIPSD